MRRFIAFILMVVTIVAAIIFNTQAVFTNNTFDNDFSNGKEIVYKLSDRDDAKEELNIENASKTIVARLDNISAKNYQVFTEGKNTIRIKFSPQTTTDLNNVTRMVESNGDFSICTASDFCIDGSEYFQKTRSSLIYQDVTPFPGFNVTSKEVHQKLLNANEEVTDTDAKKNLYIWRGKTIDDTYEGTKEDSDEGKEMLKKIVAIAPSDGNFDENNLRLYINNDLNGNNFSISSARAFVSTMNADDYGFNIERLYINNIDPILGQNSINTIYLGVGISLAVIALLLVLSYGYSGLIASVSIIAGLLLQILIFTFLGFEISPASLMGVLVTIVLTTFASITYFERVKEELTKGKNLEKANKDGYQRSASVMFDSGAIVAIVSLFAFLLGKGSIKTFAGTAFIGALSAIIVSNLLIKWMMHWLTTNSILKTQKGTFGFGFTPRIAENKKDLYKEKKYDKKLKASSIVALCLLVGSLVSIITFGSLGKTFNKSDSFGVTNRINISLLNVDKFTKKDDVQTFLEENDLGVKTYSISLVTDAKDEETKYTYISIETKELLKDEEKVDKLTNLITELDENASIDIVKSVPQTPDEYINNLFLVLGLSLLFATVYLFIRYYFAMSMAFLGTNIVTFLLAVGLISLCRIPFNAYTGFALLGAMLLISFFSLGIFARIRDIQKDKKIKSPVHEQRCEIVSDSVVFNVNNLAYTGLIILFLTCVCLIFVPKMLYSYFTIFALTSLGGIVLTLYVMPTWYLWIRKNVKFKKIDFEPLKKKLHIVSKTHKKEAPKTNEPREAIVPGIND